MVEPPEPAAPRRETGSEPPRPTVTTRASLVRHGAAVSSAQDAFNGETTEKRNTIYRLAKPAQAAFCFCPSTPTLDNRSLSQPFLSKA